MCLGSRVVYGPCLVYRRGILGMWENPNGPIHVGLWLFCHAVFGFCWLLSIVFLLVSKSQIVNWLDFQQDLLLWGCFLAILISISLEG